MQFKKISRITPTMVGKNIGIGPAMKILQLADLNQESLVLMYQQGYADGLEAGQPKKPRNR